MGKVSMAVRSAAMSHIEPRLPTILGRANMRMKLLKIVVVLLLSGSGYARPQDTGEPRRAETNSMEWVPIVPRAQEASRYTWNSGTIPHINYYRGNTDLVDGEVSVDRGQVKKSGNARRFDIPSIDSKKIREQPIKNNLTRLRNASRRPTIPIIPRTVSGNLLKKSEYNFTRDSRISNRKRATILNSTRRAYDALKMNEISMNNSEPVAQNSKFPNRGEKAESTTPFDHIAAIKKITETLTHPRLPAENKNIPDDTPARNEPNRNSKRPVRTKIRRPPGQSSKKNNRNKLKPNKNQVNKGNSTSLKNWPNGAIQSAEDFQNYNTYTSLENDLNPDESLQKPIPLHPNFNYQVSSPSIQEIVHWLKIPAFMTNGSHVIESDQINGPISIAFDPVVQNLEPNKPSRPSDVQNLKPGFIYPLDSQVTEKIPNWLRNKTKRPVHNPQTQVSQNMVVHLINTDSRKPNRTSINSVKPTVAPVLSSGSSYPSLILSQLYPTTPKPGPNVHIGFVTNEENREPDKSRPQTPLVTGDQSCPTILINSYTRINNTIQSKEGCTDLNIIINSHVFNTNVYKSTPSPVANSDYEETDKYGQANPNYPVYQTSSSQWPQSGYYNPPKNPQNHDVQVIQDTHISISSSPDDSNPSVEASLDDSGTVNDGTGSSLGSEAGNSGNSLVRPAEAPAATNVASSGSSPSPPVTPVAGSSSPNEDDDDDYDLSPSGIMDSIASVFTYFTAVNPLHYGFFSLAAAPFTALAAGVLGIFTFIYPFFFPSSFGFRRAFNNAEDNFWSNLEEVVKQSLDKYGRVNEWKSKRRKRKR